MVKDEATLSFLLLRQNLSKKNAEISKVLLGCLPIIESGIQAHMPEMQREGRIESLRFLKKYLHFL